MRRRIAAGSRDADGRCARRYSSASRSARSAASCRLLMASYSIIVLSLRSLLGWNEAARIRTAKDSVKYRRGNVVVSAARARAASRFSSADAADRLSVYGPPFLALLA